jgi:hypothetical protein
MYQTSRNRLYTYIISDLTIELNRTGTIPPAKPESQSQSVHASEERVQSIGLDIL